MHIEPVEIFSDETNAAVIRHPNRSFPGVLIQGDNLYAMCLAADDVCSKIGRSSPAFDDANRVRNALWSYLSHYRAILTDHGLPFPFSEQPSF
jgi:hypothetical protein